MILPKLASRLRLKDRGLGCFLESIRGILGIRFFGTGGNLQKVPTYQDLVDMGVVSLETAEKQAEGE